MRARAGRSRATACASSTARPTACPGWSSIATATCSRRSSSSAGVERWKATIADALLAGDRRSRASTSAATPRRASAKGWRRRPAGCAPATTARADRGRRSASTTGASRSTSPTGHKTGFYLDQRDNRKLFADSGAPLRLRARAQLLLLHRRLQRRRARRRRGARDGDRFVGAGAGARRRATSRCNGFDAARHETVDADVNQTPARAARRAAERFDAIVLDPPKFAPTVAHAERAARAYKDINRLALMLLRAGRRAVHLLVLGRHRRRPVPQDRRRRRHRRRRRRLHPRPPRRRARSPDDDRLPRRRVPEGPGHPQALSGSGGQGDPRLELGAANAEERLDVAHVRVLREEALRRARGRPAMSATWTIEHEVGPGRDAVALLHRGLGDGARLERGERFGRLAVERDLDDRGQPVAERLGREQGDAALDDAARRRAALTRRRQVAGEVWTRAARAWLVSEASRWSMVEDLQVGRRRASWRYEYSFMMLILH